VYIKSAHYRHPKVDQDLVNYDLDASDLTDGKEISGDALCIAEAFVQFAKAQNLSFWEGA
jgi:hypothetical protein